MPTETVTVIDKYVEVGSAGARLIGFYTVPSNGFAMYQLIAGKKSGRVPKILRVRMYYRVEYVRPTPLTVASGDITLLDCNGNEIRPPPIQFQLSSIYPVQENELDMTQYYTCEAPALGVNAVKVELGPAGWIPVTGYKVKVVMNWEWGW